MEKQIGVVDGIHAAVREYGTDVLMQFLGNAERVVEFLHQQLLLVGEFIRLLGGDGREITGTHRIGLAIEFAEPLFIVDMIEKTAVFHLPFRMTLKDLGFRLEL